MHIVDSALTYYALTQNGLTQADICRRFGRSDGYMSVVVRAGEGMAALAEVERSKLYRSGKAAFDTFQELIYRRNRDEVTAGFRQLVNEWPASKPSSRAEPFAAKEVGTGRERVTREEQPGAGRQSFGQSAHTRQKRTYVKDGAQYERGGEDAEQLETHAHVICSPTDSHRTSRITDATHEPRKTAKRYGSTNPMSSPQPSAT